MSGVQGATHVYVCTHSGKSVRWEPHFVKIGASRNVSQRVKSLCGTLIQEWHRPDDAQLIEYHAVRLVGVPPARGWEWFDVPVEQAVKAVNSAIALADAGQAAPSRASQMRQRSAEIARESAEVWARCADELRRLNDLAEREGWYWDKVEKTFKRPIKER